MLTRSGNRLTMRLFQLEHLYHQSFLLSIMVHRNRLIPRERGRDQKYDIMSIPSQQFAWGLTVASILSIVPRTHAGWVKKKVGINWIAAALCVRLIVHCHFMQAIRILYCISWMRIPKTNYVELLFWSRNETVEIKTNDRFWRLLWELEDHEIIVYPVVMGALVETATHIFVEAWMPHIFDNFKRLGAIIDAWSSVMTTNVDCSILSYVGKLALWKPKIWKRELFFSFLLGIVRAFTLHLHDPRSKRDPGQSNCLHIQVNRNAQNMGSHQTLRFFLQWWVIYLLFPIEKCFHHHANH